MGICASRSSSTELRARLEARHALTVGRLCLCLVSLVAFRASFSTATCAAGTRTRPASSRESNTEHNKERRSDRSAVRADSAIKRSASAPTPPPPVFFYIRMLLLLLLHPHSSLAFPSAPPRDRPPQRHPSDVDFESEPRAFLPHSHPQLARPHCVLRVSSFDGLISIHRAKTCQFFSFSPVRPRFPAQSHVWPVAAVHDRFALLSIASACPSLKAQHGPDEHAQIARTSRAREEEKKRKAGRSIFTGSGGLSLRLQMFFSSFSRRSLRSHHCLTSKHVIFAVH